MQKFTAKKNFWHAKNAKTAMLGHRPKRSRACIRCAQNQVP